MIKQIQISIVCWMLTSALWAQNISDKHMSFLNEVAKHYATASSFHYDILVKAYNKDKVVTEFESTSIKMDNNYLIDAFNTLTILNDSLFCVVDYLEKTVKLSRLRDEHEEQFNLNPGAMEMSKTMLAQYHAEVTKDESKIILTLFNYDGYDKALITYDDSTFEMEKIVYETFPQNVHLTGTTQVEIIYSKNLNTNKELFSLAEYITLEHETWRLTDEYANYDLILNMNEQP